jgi:hypothetical protein
MRLRHALLLVTALFVTAAPAAEPPLAKGEKIVFLGDSITAGGVSPKGYVTPSSRTRSTRSTRISASRSSAPA